MRSAVIASREVLADDYVPYVGHIANDTVLLDDGSMLAMFRVTGRAWETADPDDIKAWQRQLNVLCRNIISDRLVLSVHIVRTSGSSESYPPASFRSEFSRRLDAAYRAKMVTQLYRNEMFLSVLRRPASVAGHRLTAWVARKRKVATVGEDESNRHLQDVIRILKADLDPYGIMPLGLRAEGNVTFSEIGEALALILTGEHRRVPIVTGRLGRAIHSGRIIFGHEALEIRHDGMSKFAACLGLCEYPSQTWPGQLGRLLRAPYYFSLTQSLAFLAKSDAHGTLTRKQNQLVAANDKAYSQRDALVEAADQLENGDFVMGSHHLTMTVFADAVQQLTAVVPHARSDLADCGAVVAREDLGLEATFWSQLPGNSRLRTRPGVISSMNWCGLAPLHGYPEGREKGYWGDPIAMFRTAAGTPYRFHFHVNDIGNSVMFGPTGSGKTVLLLFALAQAERAGAQVVFFDKDSGGEILTRAVGGSYLRLPSGKPTGLAPLRALASTPEDVAFLTRWVGGLIEAGGHKLRPDDVRRIRQGAMAMLRLEPADRSMSEFRAFLGHADMEGAGAHLAK
jgi:type IV secretion system protein VirB4